MAKGDVRIIDTGGKEVVSVRTFPTKAGLTAINAGEPVIIGRSVAKQGLNAYVVALTDGLPLTGADYFVGIAANSGSHTTSADGYVDVYLDTPGIVYALKALTASTFNTKALVENQTFYRIPFDLTSSSYTADVTTDSSTAGLMIVGGEPTSYTVYVVAREGVSWIR